MRHHGFSCSSLYTVTPEQAQENLLIEATYARTGNPLDFVHVQAPVFGAALHRD